MYSTVGARRNFFREEQNILGEKNLKLMALGLTKVSFTKIELLKVSIFYYVLRV